MEGWGPDDVYSYVQEGFDPEIVEGALQVDGWGPSRVHEWAVWERHPPYESLSEEWVEHAYDRLRQEDVDLGRYGSIEELLSRSQPEPLNPPVRVGPGYIEDLYYELVDAGMDLDRWPDLDAMEQEVQRRTFSQKVQEEGIEELEFRPDDERFRHPETEEEYEEAVVMFYIRDVSGSMGEDKKDLVERTLTPIDWYLRGKYDEAVSVYIAHDSTAWEVERMEFFGLDSGGGTTVSSAYEIVDAIASGDFDSIEETQGTHRSRYNWRTGQMERGPRIRKDEHPDEGYPFEDWNRYVFAAGDGENWSNDTTEHVIPYINEIDANLHAYVQTQPGGGGRGSLAADLEDYDDWDDGTDPVVTRVNGKDDVIPGIKEILMEA